MENEKLVIDAVNILATKLGTTGTHLWGVLVRQAPISSIVSLSFFAIGTLLAMVGWVAAFKIVMLETDRSIDSESANFIVVIFSAISFLISLILLFNVESVNIWISGLCNPEYWAFKQVISTFK